MSDVSRPKKKRKMSFTEYTKVAVKWLLVYGCIAATVPYVLSFLGRDPVTSLGERWLVAVVAVILGYMAKAAFGKYQEEKTRIKDRELDLEECSLEEDLPPLNETGYEDENGGTVG